MEKLIELWIRLKNSRLIDLKPGISDEVKLNPYWSKLPKDLRCILQINNGQITSEYGFFGVLNQGKTFYEFHFLDFESILKIRNKMKIREIENTDIPFAIVKCRDVGGFGFSINSRNGQIDYISFNEYDYNGGTVNNKGKYKYADSMLDFLDNQIMLKEFE